MQRSKENNFGYCDLENVARMLEIACAQDEFSSVNDDNFAETREAVAAMKYRVRCWDELNSKYLLLLEKFRQIDWMMHKGKICFSAFPIVMLLGITLKDIPDDAYDGIDDVVSDEKRNECAAGEHWIEENAVGMLINSESPYPVWLRERLSSWFRIHCEEIRARNILA